MLRAWVPTSSGSRPPIAGRWRQAPKLQFLVLNSWPNKPELLPAIDPGISSEYWVVMGKQYNKVEKRRRRHDYLRRKKAAAKARK